MHAVVHRLDRLVFFLFTLFERVNALILNKMNDKSIFVPVISNLTLCWVTSFCVDLAWHLNFLILSMTIVWLIQQAHWAATSSVSFWHLWMAILENVSVQFVNLYLLLFAIASCFMSWQSVVFSAWPV